MPPYRFAIRAAGINFLFSVCVALMMAPVVLGIWYPYPFGDMLNMRKLFFIVLAIHLGIGFGLTYLLSNERKSRRALWIDWTLVASIQWVALIYGIYVLQNARPIALVFERDRFVVVAAREIDSNTLGDAPKGLQDLSWLGPQLLGIRKPVDNSEFFRDLGMSLVGLEPSRRPGWWLPYSQVVEEAKAAARPVAELIARHPEARADIEQALKRNCRMNDAIKYLPLTSAKTLDWTMLLSSSGTPCAYIHVDGFLS